jgi:hypothetical protein
VQSSQDWGVTREPEGWAGGGRASEEEEGRGVRRCKGRCTVRHSHLLPSPPQLVTSEH